VAIFEFCSVILSAEFILTKSFRKRGVGGGVRELKNKFCCSRKQSAAFLEVGKYFNLG
jgi:hypothetical protein